MKTYKGWRDIRAKGRSPERLAQLEREASDELLELDLKEIRDLVGKTQGEVAALAAMTQPEVSKIEARSDYKLSTLRRVVEALGGELEVIANFGDRRVRLRAVG